MIQLLYDIALRLGLGLILGVLLIILITIIETAFYNYHKQIHLLIVASLISLIIYALGDIGIDILRI
jgi:NhaP-type Na+/H+ or K+/H+ antiporter